MKSKIVNTKSILSVMLFAVMIASGGGAWADCQISQPSKDHGQAPTAPQGIGQSFTACQTGYINSLRIHIMYTDNPNARLEFQPDAGIWQADYVQNIVLTSGENLIPLSPPFTVNAGVVYAFGIFPSVDQLSVWSDSEVLPGGEAFWIIGTNITGIAPPPDLAFGLVIENNPNAAPTAHAGGDQTVTDSDLNGYQAVSLDGSLSSDPGGSIISYKWRKGGATIATGANPTVTLARGVHVIELIVTDNNGFTDTDSVTITVDSPPTVGTLLSNGLVDPNNLSDFTPTFSWTFADADAGDAQAAFDIRVRPESSGTYIWNYSQDGSQQNITYNGTTDLAANTAYIWSVRVWDSGKTNASAWAEGEFTVLDIGLRVFDGTEIIKLAVDYASAAYPLRIYKDGVTYGIVLVDPADPNASSILVQTSSGIKALRKME